MSKDTKTGLAAILNLAAILMIFAVAGVGNFQNAAIATFQAAWPEVSTAAINNVSTLPSLVSLPVMLIVGAIAGKKVKYRPIVMFALIISLIGGLGPYFFAPSWTMVLVFRGLLGVGAGCFGVRTAVLLGSLPEQKQTTWVGIASAVMVAVNIVIAPVVGWLARISWKTPFLINCIVLVALVLCLFFLKEPAVIAEPAKTEEKSSGKKETLGAKPVFYAVFHALSTGLMYPLLLGVSSFLVNYQIGDAVLAGTAITCYSIGSLASMFLGPIQKLLKRATLPVCYALCAVGLLVVLIGKSLPAVMIGNLIAGAAWVSGFAMLQVYNAQVCAPSRLGFATTLILVGNNLGVYLASYVMLAFHAVLKQATMEDSAFLGGAIAYGIYVVLCLIPGLVVPKQKKDSQTNV